MKFLPLIIIFFTHIASAQRHEDFYVVKKDGDTTFFEFRAYELESFSQETTLILSHNTKNKKEKIKEYDTGDIKLYYSDTSYWAGFAKFYDDYFIALIARKKQIKKSTFELYKYEYRRIYYSEVTQISNTSFIAKDYNLSDWSYEVLKQPTNPNKREK